MRTITKVFSLLITAVTVFMYKKEVQAYNSCSVLFYQDYGTSALKCSSGQYTLNSACTACPDSGTTAQAYTYAKRTSFNLCSPCTSTMVNWGACPSVGALNTYGLDMWQWSQTQTAYTGIPVTSCFIAAGGSFSDTTGAGVYSGGSCYYTN
ncbi:MAG: hypothetical protein LBF37_00860 [Rickettsiales bacterium]|jgi:hypothetical protein|nr:hypothetical protein [Rickettsiales bacterium]